MCTEACFYAGARTLWARLPEPTQAERPVVVLRLRGRAMLGSTAFAVKSRRPDPVMGRASGPLIGLEPAVSGARNRPSGPAATEAPAPSFTASPEPVGGLPGSELHVTFGSVAGEIFELAGDG